ncbi:MAG: exodeoxyribonuclease VII small subunit [Sphingomonas sp.]|nr:MAG: exodeoxyribonuclease VII small subunit [Sphingomonas sp.]
MDTPIEDLAFEDALKELELIVGKLESGDTPLQQAIELYERGNKLRQRCADRLDGDGKPAGVRPFAAG